MGVTVVEEALTRVGVPLRLPPREVGGGVPRGDDRVAAKGEAAAEASFEYGVDKMESFFPAAPLSKLLFMKSALGVARGVDEEC